MKDRCYNQSNTGYTNYGARGIQMCARWYESFEAFLADMGPHPGPGYSLDRIDNNGNYEPGNCRWATKKEQARNKANNRVISFGGETKTVSEWAEERKILPSTLIHRINNGWPAEVALTVGGRCK